MVCKIHLCFSHIIPACLSSLKKMNIFPPRSHLIVFVCSRSARENVSYVINISSFLKNASQQHTQHFSPHYFLAQRNTALLKWAGFTQIESQLCVAKYGLLNKKIKK